MRILLFGLMLSTHALAYGPNDRIHICSDQGCDTFTASDTFLSVSPDHVEACDSSGCYSYSLFDVFIEQETTMESLLSAPLKGGKVYQKVISNMFKDRKLESGSGADGFMGAMSSFGGAGLSVAQGLVNSAGIKDVFGGFTTDNGLTVTGRYNPSTKEWSVTATGPGINCQCSGGAH